MGAYTDYRKGQIVLNNILISVLSIYYVIIALKTLEINQKYHDLTLVALD